MELIITYSLSYFPGLLHADPLQLRHIMKKTRTMQHRPQEPRLHETLITTTTMQLRRRLVQETLTQRLPHVALLQQQQLILMQLQIHMLLMRTLPLLQGAHLLRMTPTMQQRHMPLTHMQRSLPQDSQPSRRRLPLPRIRTPTITQPIRRERLLRQTRTVQRHPLELGLPSVLPPILMVHRRAQLPTRMVHQRMLLQRAQLPTRTQSLLPGLPLLPLIRMRDQQQTRTQELSHPFRVQPILGCLLRLVIRTQRSTTQQHQLTREQPLQRMLTQLIHMLLCLKLETLMRERLLPSATPMQELPLPIHMLDPPLIPTLPAREDTVYLHLQRVC